MTDNSGALLCDLLLLTALAVAATGDKTAQALFWSVWTLLFLWKLLNFLGAMARRRQRKG